jgi:hypothetical protein
MKNKILILLTLCLFYSCKEKSTVELVQDLSSNDNVEDCVSISEKIASKLDLKTANLLNENLKSDTLKLSNSIATFINHYRLNFNDFNSNGKKNASKILTELLSYKDNQVISSESKLDLIYRDIVTQSIINLEKSENEDQVSLLLDKILISYGNTGLSFMLYKYEETHEDIIISSIIKFDRLAINYLINFMVDNENYQTILAQFGEPVVDLLKSLLSDSNREVRFAAAEVLVKMIKYHPDAIQSLTDALDDQNLSLISSNYPFYIKLGAPGSEELLLRSLKINFSKQMALDYLNCGNSYIEEESTNISRSFGYQVTVGSGFHSGPRWGEEKENINDNK